MSHASLSDLIRGVLHPLEGRERDYDPLMQRVGDAQIVLLGEATHGTHEFCRERGRITRRLILEKGFDGVAIEGDWPDALRVHRAVRVGGSPVDSLAGFKRFPTWMWRNTDVVDFLRFLVEHNRDRAASRSAGFFGIDLYSLSASVDAVLEYLDRTDPEAARRARARYGCFEHFGEDSQLYGLAVTRGHAESCEPEVVAQLVELQRRAGAVESGSPVEREERFFAEQNARLVRNAERYYRAMFRGRATSWNLRDQHMTETLDALVEHLKGQGRPGKLVVWAHNSHLGDARATQMADMGELNVGQLVRDRWGQAAVLVGFTTYEGTVTAADDWGEPAQRMRVRPALPGSWEALLHDVGVPRFLLDLREGPAALREPRLERAIGVVYRPRTERMSHYFDARLAEQFDLVLHFDRTRAVEPLERSAGWVDGEAPETWPSGL